jgi:hypothetical protein
MKKEIDLFAQLKSDRAKLHTSTLANQDYVNVPKRSLGLTPMDQVATEGAASQGMVSGRMPWWVLITGWMGVGFYGAIVLSIVFSGSLPQSLLFNPGFWILLLILMIYIAIMWRGTSRKLANRKLRPR